MLFLSSSLERVFADSVGIGYLVAECLRKFDFGCAYSSGETPVPIPNTAVKPTSGNGTAVLTVGE